MNNKKLLVVIAETDDFALLKQKIGSSAAADLDFDLRNVYSIVEAQHLADGKPDFFFLRISPDKPTDLVDLRAAISALGPTPVAIWTTQPDLVLVRAALDEGAAACICDTMSASDMLLHMLAAVAYADKLRQQLRHHHAQSVVTLEAIADGVICTDDRAVVTFLNSAARRLLMCDPDEGIGQPITEYMTFKDCETDHPITHPAHQVIATMQTFRVPPGTALVRRNGSEIMIEDCACPIIGECGELAGVVIVFHDITEAWEMRAQVDYLAWHDYLTELPNRFAITRHLDHTLAHATSHHQKVPLLYLDLDRFKLVNDTLGHSAGDLLLRSVAERLRKCFRLTDLVGRQGGDEFVVVMAPGSTLEEATLASARIIDALSESHDLNGSSVQVGCSIGIAVFPEHGASADILMHHADTALQCTKTGGRNSWRIFAPDLRTDAVQRKKLEDALRATLQTGGMTLFYQPKIRLGDGAVYGCEALLRWHHPDWGWIPPTAFIPCAEASGLIIHLGKLALNEAIRQAKAWQAIGLDIRPIAVNVSADELCHPEFVDHIERALYESGIDPSLIELELTESVLMRDLDSAIERLGRLRALGVSLAIDDFGTGYSSLSYLAEFPINVLKIDRSFVHGIHRAGTRQQALLQGILTLAKTLSFEVVAEGIETAEEERFLTQAGCKIGQGYYYAAPMDAHVFEQFVISRRYVVDNTTVQ